MELTPEQIEILTDLRNTINDSIEKIGTAMPLFKEAVQSVFAAEALVADILADDDICMGEYNDFIFSILKGRSTDDKRAILKRINAVYGTLRNIKNRPISYLSHRLGFKIDLEPEDVGFGVHLYSKRDSWSWQNKDKLDRLFDESTDTLRSGQEIECDTLAYNIDSNPEIVDELVKVLRILTNGVKNNEVYLGETGVSLSPRIHGMLTKNDETIDVILTDYVLGKTDYDTTVNNLAAVVQSSTIDAKRIIYALL